MTMAVRSTPNLWWYIEIPQSKPPSQNPPFKITPVKIPWSKSPGRNPPDSIFEFYFNCYYSIFDADSDKNNQNVLRATFQPVLDDLLAILGPYKSWCAFIIPPVKVPPVNIPHSKYPRFIFELDSYFDVITVFFDADSKTG